MIIVEGLDNTGKTTLVAKIMADFPDLTHIPSIGNKHHVPSIREQAWRGIRDDVSNPLTIWDRSRIISEYIYNPVIKGRPTAFDHEEYFLLLGWFLTNDPLIIWCHRPYDKIAAGFDGREQLSGVYENLQKLYDGYVVHMHYISWFKEFVLNQTPVLPYDFEQEDTFYPQMKTIIDGYIRKAKDFMARGER